MADSESEKDMHLPAYIYGKQGHKHTARKTWVHETIRKQREKLGEYAYHRLVQSLRQDSTRCKTAIL